VHIIIVPIVCRVVHDVLFFFRTQTSDTQSLSFKCDAQCAAAFVDSYSSCERKKLQVQNSVGFAGQDGPMFRHQTPVWTVQVRALGGIIVLCSWQDTYSASRHPETNGTCELLGQPVLGNNQRWTRNIQREWQCSKPLRSTATRVKALLVHSLST